MSIICFTKVKLPQYVSPKIATISQHGKYIGETATQMIVDRIENQQKNWVSAKIIKTSLTEKD